MTGDGGDVAAGMASTVIAAAFGDPDVLTVIEEPAAEPGPRQARISVRAAGSTRSTTRPTAARSV
jgi:hypothetical protein